MKKLVIVTTALLVSACGRQAPLESVEALAANPERLKELRAQCKGGGRADLGDAQCNAVAEATRRRFMSRGSSPYADDPLPQPAPLPPKDKAQ